MNRDDHGRANPIRPTISKQSHNGVVNADVPERAGQELRLENVKMYDVEVVGAEVLDFEEGEEIAEAEGEAVEITEQEAEEECEPMRIAPDPGLPSVGEMEKHRAEGHVPFRSWCEWCVAGRGVGEHHKQGPKSKIL